MNNATVKFDKTDSYNTLKTERSNIEQLKYFGSDFSKLFGTEIKMVLKNKTFWLLGMLLPIVSIILVGLVMALTQSSLSETLGVEYYGSPDIPSAALMIPLITIAFMTMPTINMTFRKTNQLKRLGNIGIQKFNYYLTYMLIGFVFTIIVNLILFGPVTLLSIWGMAKTFDSEVIFNLYSEINYFLFIPYYLITVMLFLSIGYYISMKLKSTGAVTSIATYFLLVSMFFGGLVTLFGFDSNGDKVYIARIIQTLTLAIPFLVFNNIILLATESAYYSGYEVIYYIEYAISMAFAIAIVVMAFIGNKKYFNYSLRN